jgi:hypothetical protein
MTVNAKRNVRTMRLAMKATIAGKVSVIVRRKEYAGKNRSPVPWKLTLFAAVMVLPMLIDVKQRQRVLMFPMMVFVEGIVPLMLIVVQGTTVPGAGGIVRVMGSAEKNLRSALSSMLPFAAVMARPMTMLVGQRAWG